MKKLIIVICVVAVCIAAAVVLLTLRPWQSDAARFHARYPLAGEDNVFTFISVREAADKLETGTGIIYLGFPECPWCQTYVPLLNMTAQAHGLERVYYANILNDRENHSPDYQRIVRALENRLDLDEDGNPRVFVPFIVAVKDGVIVGHDNESGLNFRDDTIPSPLDFWTNWRVEALMQRLGDMIDAVK